MAAGEAGGGGSAGGQSGGQSGNVGGPQGGPPQARARIGDFSSGAANAAMPSHATRVEQPSQRATVIDRNEIEDWKGIEDPFSDESSDGQSLALAEDDSLNGELMDERQMAALHKQWEESHKRWNDLSAQDDLPEDFGDKFMSVMIDGVRERRPARECALGYMRERDYSNGKRELAAAWQELQARENGLARFMADLDNGQTFIEAITAIGKFKGFDEASRIYGKQVYAELQMTPQQRQVMQMNRQLDADRKALQRHNAMLQQQLQAQTQQAPAPNYENLYNQLSQLIPKAGQQVGWVNDPLHEHYFNLHFTNLLPTLHGDVSTEFIAQVMRAAQEDVDIAVRNSQERRAQEVVQNPQQQQLPPAGRAAAAPANRAAVSTNPQQTDSTRRPRARISDFGQVSRRR